MEYFRETLDEMRRNGFDRALTPIASTWYTLNRLMEISTITPIAFGFILIFALFGALRGGLRVAASFLALLAAGLFAFPLTPVLAPALASTSIPLALQPALATAAAGLLIFIALRIFFGLILSYRERKRRARGVSPHSPLDRGFGALLGAIWGTLLVVVVLVGISLISDVQAAISMPAQTPESLDRAEINDGTDLPDPSDENTTVARIDRRPEQPSQEDQSTRSIERLGKKVSSSVFGTLVEKSSPLGEQQAETIRGWISLLEDPQGLQRLRTQPEVQSLLENPLILEATSDPEIAAAARRRDLFFLLNHPTIASLARDPGLRQEILSLDLDHILRQSQSH